MQAVVLVGGEGVRLRPLTYAVPKPLLPVLGRPILGWLLDKLPPDVDEVVLAVAHGAEALRAWARTGDDPALDGRTATVIEERTPLGTGGAIGNCRSRLNGRFIAKNGDLLSDVDMVRQLAFHEKRGGRATLALYEVDDPSRFGVVAQDPDDRIHSFVEKPAPGKAPSRMVNAGAYILEPDVLDLIRPGVPVSIEREVFPVLAARAGALYGLAFQGLWIDCGTPMSYVEVHRLMLARAGKKAWTGKGAVVAADATLHEAAVGANARVDAGAILEASVVLDHAHVRRGAKLTRSIIGPDAEVGAGAVLTDTVVGPDESVPPGARLDGARVGLRPEHAAGAAPSTRIP